jgi:hypothetical protein
MWVVSSCSQVPLRFVRSKIFNNIEITDKGSVYNSMEVYHDLTFIYSTDATTFQSVQQRATGWTVARDSSLLHRLQTASGAHPASYPMGTGAVLTGAKRLRREADRSPPSNAKVKNNGVVPPLPHVFTAWCLIN